jgi:hypothetical protein
VSRGRRALASFLGALIVLGACSEARPAEPDRDRPPASTTDAAPAGTATTEPSTSFAVPLIAPSPQEKVTHALLPSTMPDIDTEIRFEHPDFGPPQVRSGDLKRGGPAPDGIPSIDEPRFHRIGDVTFLRDEEPVFVLRFGGETRAYPLQILVWHEIVNDTVAGVPLAVTYCPLCNSAAAFDRRHQGRVLSFGVSGALWNNALVMFDRQTFSLWSHFNGEGLLGVLAGVRLTAYPVALASWAQFRRAHPDGIVLSRDTGYDKDYGRNPYPGYEDIAEPPFTFEGEVDGRYAAKTRLVGLDLPGGPQAVTLERLRRDRVVRLDDAGRALVAWWRPGTSSALDARAVADGRDVGTTGVFESVLDGRPLTFESSGEGFRDRETGSTWDVFGVAVGGELAGRRLTPVTHVDTFWFAWSVFQPRTVIAG